jgi:hypothetical protein
LYRGVDAIGYASAFDGKMHEFYAPDGESSEYLATVMSEWIKFSCG